MTTNQHPRHHRFAALLRFSLADVAEILWWGLTMAALVLILTHP